MTKSVQDPPTPGRNIWTNVMTQGIDGASKRFIPPCSADAPHPAWATSPARAAKRHHHLRARDAGPLPSSLQSDKPLRRLGSRRSRSLGWTTSTRLARQPGCEVPPLPTSACVARVLSKRLAVNKPPGSVMPLGIAVSSARWSRAATMS